MKILHVLPALNPVWGGPLTGALAMSQGLSAIGHRAELLGLMVPGEPLVTDSDMTIHAISGARGRYGYCPPLKRWLVQHAAAYDALIVHGLWRYYGWVTSRVALRAGVPYFVWAHGSLDPYSLRCSRAKFLLKLIYRAAFESRVCAGARAVLFTTEEELELARPALGRRPTAVVATPAGVSIDGDAVAGAPMFLNAFPHLAARDLVLFLGRLHPKKGLDLLIEAFASVAMEFPRAHLVVSGPDQIGWRPEIEALARRHAVADRVSFTGMLDGVMKSGAFAVSRVFALPSRQENFAFAAVEALGAGLPVLISRRVNIWREVEAAGAGMVVEPTAAGTAEGLRNLLAAPDRLAAMGRNARALAVRRYESRQVARDFIECLQGCRGSAVAAGRA